MRVAILLPRLARRRSQRPPERSGELARRGEAGRERNLENRERSLPQQLAGAREPQREVVLVHGAAEVSAECALELSQ
jgi:hypothetical protein